MRPNVRNDHPQWYQQTQHLPRHISGLVARSTDWVQHQCKQGWRKTDKLQKRFGLLHNDKPLSKWPIFQCSHLIFSNNQITLAWGKTLNRAEKCTKWTPIVILTASAPSMPLFWPCSKLIWLGAAPVKTRLTENQKMKNWFSLLHNGKNYKTPGFRCSPLTFSWNFLFPYLNWFDVFSVF